MSGFRGSSETDATYSVVMNDYMANGGDGMDFMTGQPVETAGVTVRDLVIAHVRNKLQPVR